MNKGLLLIMLFTQIAFGQINTSTTKSGKYQMNVPDLGAKKDSAVVWNGTSKLLKYLPISEIKSITNLDYLATPTGGTVFSSSGNDASVPLATTVNAGLQSPADKSKINGLDVALANKVDKVAGKGLSTEDYTTVEKSKLAGVQNGATANSTDAQLRDRSTHTGTQAISTVVGLQAAIDAKLNLSLVNANNGVAPLDAGGKVPFANLPASLMIYKGMWNPATNTPTLSDASGTVGWVYKTNAAGTANLGSGNQTFFNGDFLIHNGTKWERSAGTDAVVSVNGQQGIVTLNKNDIGLGSVDNTTDLNKPISTATQTALNLKANDADVVHKFGLETIADKKIFTGRLEHITTAQVTDTHYDGIWSDYTSNFDGYNFHGVRSGSGGGGVVGAANLSTGVGDAIVGRRRNSGSGNGGTFKREETGAGSAVQAENSSSGIGAAVTAIKSGNSEGTAIYALNTGVNPSASIYAQKSGNSAGDAMYIEKINNAVGYAGNFVGGQGLRVAGANDGITLISTNVNHGNTFFKIANSVASKIYGFGAGKLGVTPDGFGMKNITDGTYPIWAYASGGVAVGGGSDLGSGTLNVTGNITTIPGVNVNHAVTVGQLNAYQPLLTNPITGIGTAGNIPVFTGAGTLGNSSISEFVNRVAVSAKPLLVTGGFGIGFQLEDGFKITREIGHTAFFYDNIKKMELSPNGLLLNNLSVGGSVSSRDLEASNFLAIKGVFSSFPTSGNGLEFWNSNATTSLIQSYNRASLAYNEISIRGSSVSFMTNAVERAKIHTSGGVSIGTPTDAGAGNLLVAGITSSVAGFQVTSPVANSRNRLVSFGGGSDVTGLSYFAGTSGLNGISSYGLHFTNATSAGSLFNFGIDGKFKANGTATAAPATVDTELATWGQAKAVTRPYKVYTFIINQVGTSTPTVAILENTLGGTPVWTRTSTGSNFCTLSGAFPVGKVFCSITSGNNTAFYSMYEIGPNQVTLKTYNETGVFKDSMLTQASGEIRVYP